VIAVRGLIAAAFAGAETYLPLMLVREHHWDAAAAGLLLTLGTLTWTTASWVQSRSKDPRARYRYSRIGTSLLSVGVLVFLTAAFPGTPAWTAAAGWAVAGFGIGLVYSSTSLLSLQLTPPERHGEASSALTTSESLTAATALALGGALFAALLPAAAHLADAALQNGSVGPVPYLGAVGVAALASLIAIVGARRMTTRPEQVDF
jgi:MFS family permease